MSKENLEKTIKQELMQKDKETIINLYLQMKFERDLFDEQLAELKAEKKDAEECAIDFQNKNTELETEKEDLKTQMDFMRESYQQQLKEKDEDIKLLNHTISRLEKQRDKAQQDYGEEHKLLNEIGCQNVDYEKQVVLLKSSENCLVENIKTLQTRLKTNTHQVCEKIRKFCDNWQTTDDFNNIMVMYKETMAIRTQPSLEEFLDQIEKGEV